MRAWTRCFLPLLLAAFATCAAAEDRAGPERFWGSKKGHFRVAYESRLQPPAINRIHSWVLHVESGDGEPVEDAEITVDGGMPAHDHGLPTRPQVTRNLGAGDYLVEGMRFHMNGSWEILVTVSAAGVTDVVVIPLVL